ncbi:LamG domain-containing protein [Acidobacteria bacterium AH-259-G07]|nr:LamG domain-containing protein [Acidobacteria bacterium AH-259-G07]
MLRRIHTVVHLGLLFAVTVVAAAQGQGIQGMPVVGYADRFSVQPSEIIRFMVSCELPKYRADIVRLIHGDPNPKGPGFKEEVIQASTNKEYPGRHQDLRSGSYVIVADSRLLRLTGSLTLQAWITATTPHKGAQGILTKWSATDRLGYGLFLDTDGSLALWLGDANGQVEKVRTGKSLRPWTPASVYAGGHQMVNSTSSYFVAATFDAESGDVALYQEPVVSWPMDESRVLTQRSTAVRSIGQSDAPFLMAGFWEWRSTERIAVGGHFNGKIESPRLFGRALTKDEIQALRQGGSPQDPVAAWDFSLDISSRKVTDTSPNKLNGQTVHMPARAMTGYGWTGQETDFQQAPGQYGAIYFHDDDLDDAGWEVDFELQIPENLKSGVYAARLRAGNGEDYVPFFVRPRKGTSSARIAFLVPTFSYLAYGNFFGPDVPELLSLYDQHSDGSGVFYASRLRPILNMRPNGRETWKGITFPHQFSADLHLVDWLDAKGHEYDVITDEDLHFEGTALLAPYKVVITGSHPEYWSGQMLDGLEKYLHQGGRLMYLGGNGFYWVTSMDPERRHTIEVRRRDGTQIWEAAPGEYRHSTTGEVGGLWRFRGRPPQKLVGVGFTAMGPEGRPFRRQPGSFDPRAAFVFEGIGPDELIGDFANLVMEYGAAGQEIDRFDHLLGTPAHALLLATASGFSDESQHVVEEMLHSDPLQGGTTNPWVRGDMVYFEYPNGGAVLSVGSINWCGSLSYNGYNNNVSQITDNVLKQFASDDPLSRSAAQ